MILLRRKSADFVYVAAALVIVTTILFFYREEIADDFFRQFPPSDFGFSSRQQIQNQCSTSCTKIISRALVHKVVSAFSDKQPEALALHIGFKNMQILLEDQQTAIARNQLLDPREVRADIVYREQLYPVNIRLKGELKDHWSEPGRMSLRVSVRRGRTVMGFSSFSLHKPESRQHPYEPAFEDFVRAAGGLAVRHKYAELSVNGEKWGIWNVEERVSTELLEKQNRKDSLVFNIALDKFWRYVRSSTMPYTDPSYRFKDVHLFADVYQAKKIRRNPALRRQYSYVLQHLMIDGGDQVYDWPAMARSVILAYIWGTNHVLLGGNSRYYLNPYTLKLEPITSDQSWPKSIEYGLTYPYPLPYRRFVESETFRNLYTDTLRSVVEKEAELFPFFSGYYKLFPNDIHTPLRMVSDNMRRAARTGYQDILKLHRDILPTDRFVYLGNPAAAKKLTPEVREQLQVHVHIRHFTDGIVRIRNLLDIPVALEEVRASDGILWEGLPEIPAKGEIDLDTGFDGIRDNEITVVTRIDAFRRSHEASLSLIPLSELNNPLLGYSDPTDTHEFIQGDRNGYRFDRGSWRINLPLILNGDTEIPAGTTLDFAPNAYLVVHGALNARGEPAAPIRMQGAAGRWKGIYVYDSPQISEWSHVEIADAAELQDGPLLLSGAVNLYRSDLIAGNVTIRNSSGEDALNIVQSKVDLNNLTIVDARSDAVDLDFCSGVLRNYSVIGANGDGLDISGGSLIVENLSATNINDKALSAGEASAVTLRRAKMTSVGVGIASKDGSSVYAEDVNISNVTLHPAMSYSKKDFYGPPELKLVRLEYTEGVPLLRQSGSEMSLDGKEIEESALDVKALYLKGVMAK